MTTRFRIPLLSLWIVGAGLLAGCDAQSQNRFRYGLYLAGWALIDYVPAICPPPVIEREEFDLPGFGKMVRFSGSSSLASSASLSDLGQVGLNARTPEDYGLCGFAVVWGDDMKVLARPNVHTRVLGLNDVGLAVGLYYPPGGFLVNHAVLWRDGEFVTLTDPAGPQSYATAVNNAGVIVGQLGDEFGSEPVRWDAEGDAWTMTRLGDALDGYAVDVNERGQIVGTLYDSPPSEQNKVSLPFLWQDGELIRLPDLGGPGTGSKQEVVSALNDAGWIVGTLDLPSQEELGEDERPAVRAVLWMSGEVTDLGTLAGLTSRASDLNDVGQIVGSSATADSEGHAFIWEDGVMRDLNDFVPLELGITLEAAIAINNEGVILCQTEESYWTGDLVMLIPSATE